MNARVLFYVQHLLGVGHLKRAEILAQAMAAARPRRDGRATAAAPFPEVPFRGVRIAELPPAAIAGEDFSDAPGRRGRARRRALESGARCRAARARPRHRSRRDPDRAVPVRPAAVRIRACCRFWKPSVAPTPRPMVACSVRDVLVARKARPRAEEAAAVARRFFDAVLVHGDPALIPFGATFGAADADRRPHPLHRLCRRARRRRGACRRRRRGARLGRRRRGRSAAPLRGAGGAADDGARRPHVALPRRAEPARRRLTTGSPPRRTPARSSSASARISPRAWERPRCRSRRPATTPPWTSCDRARRAVVVPYEARGETEQRLRSDLLAAKGLLTVVPAAELSPGASGRSRGRGAGETAPSVRLRRPCGRAGNGSPGGRARRSPTSAMSRGDLA